MGQSKFVARWRKLIEIERRAENADGEVGEQRSVVIKLNPANDAVVLHILRNFSFVNPQMFGKF